MDHGVPRQAQVLTADALTNPHACQPAEYWGDPVARADRVALVVHGRNQDPAWMHEHLVSLLDVPGTAYLAPTADDSSWYPAGFMAPAEQNEPRCTWGLERLDALIEELLGAGRDRGAICLIGFSQGGCLVLEYLSRHGGRFGGVAGLTAGLIGPPGTTWEGPSLSGVPVLLATSDVDEWVPLHRVQETQRALATRGADVTFRVYEGMSHVINEDEVALVEKLLSATPRATP